MGQYIEIYIVSAISILFVTSLLMTIFAGVLYFLTKKNKSILLLCISDFILLLMAVLLYLQYYLSAVELTQWASVLSLAIVTFWVEAIFLILDINTQKIQFIIINSANVLITCLLILSVHYSYMIYAITPVFVFVISICGTIQIHKARFSVKKADAMHSMTVFGIYAFFNLFMGIYRFIRPISGSSFASHDFMALLFFAVSLALAYIVNYTVLYLNFSSLTNKLEILYSIDVLTGVYSRRVVFELLNQKLASLRRSGSNLGVALLDIDGFKRINDVYGHPEGDRVLKLFAKKIKSCLRENDIIGRIGGEEFVLVLETPSEEEGRLALMRIKDELCNCRFIEDEQITFSAGYLFIDKDSPQMTETEIIQITDRRMYEAKALGKNMIV